MKSRNPLRPVAAVLLFLAIPAPFTHAADGWLGELAPLALDNAIASTGRQLDAVQPDATPLSDADKQILTEIATQGIRQMELSKVAASLGSSDDVRMIAKVEIAGQTATAEKLRQIALAGGASFPIAPDEETTRLVENLRSESGPGLDRLYLKTGGIAGHERMMAAMARARSDAKSPALRELSVAILPLIHTQLRVARVELAEMK